MLVEVTMVNMDRLEEASMVNMDRLEEASMVNMDRLEEASMANMDMEDMMLGHMVEFIWHRGAGRSIPTMLCLQVTEYYVTV
jgi:hypothetical protein